MAERRLYRINQFIESHPEFTFGQIRKLIFDSQRNGLAESGAILKLSRRVFIDPDKFFEWIDAQQPTASPHFSPGVCRQPVEQLVVATAGLDVLHRVLWARDHAHQLVQATFWFIFALAAINIL